MKRLYRKIYLTILGSLVLVVRARGAGLAFAASGRRWRRRSTWPESWSRPHCRRRMRRRPTQQAALDDLAARLGTDLALFDRGPAARRLVGRPACRALRRRRRRLELRARRPGMDACRCPMGAGWSRGVPDLRRSPLLTLIALPRRRGARRRAIGLAGRPRPDPPARAAAGRRRDARRRRPRRPRRGRGPGRGRRARGKLQPRRRPHRGAGRRAPHAARQRLARVAHAAVAHPPGHRPAGTQSRCGARAELRADIAELDRLIDEILLASRLDAGPTLGAVEPVELLALAAEECARYDDVRPRRRRGDDRGRSAAAAPPRPQPARERGAARPAARPA